jgi:hypothetical protein
MLFSSYTAALALGMVALVSAQDSTFEPPDFNVTDALLDQGVNISALPELESLTTRSSTAGCSIAVSSPPGLVAALAEWHPLVPSLANL